MNLEDNFRIERIVREYRSLPTEEHKESYVRDMCTVLMNQAVTIQEIQKELGAIMCGFQSSEEMDEFLDSLKR